MKTPTTRRDRPLDDAAPTVTLSGQRFEVLGQHAPGTRIGRYIIESKIGSGGMGVVYRARDPELDRDVALKLLRAARREGSAGTRARARLLREAKALAQLSHPNVVAAYDVGAFGDGVFVAMELVDGITLKEWLHAETRHWRVILEVFVAAGQGIAAAHAAGLIHRDIKPDNILVGSDGRVVVVDFGLARASNRTALAASTTEESGACDHSSIRALDLSVSSTPDAHTSSTRNPAPPAGCARTLSPSMLSADLTCAGAVLGTPGYMAPEQYLGDAVDPRSDQFSFCVALYEALYGHKPFHGRTVEDVRARVLEGALDATPHDTSVPRRLRKILTRGLSRNADDRFPTMGPLLGALRSDPRTRWKRGAIAIALLGVLGGSLAISRRPADGPGPCTIPAGELNSGAWNSNVGADLDHHFRALGVAHGHDTALRVSTLLAARAASHREMRQRICAATRIEGSQSEQLMDLRMRCLHRRAHETEILIQLLRSANDSRVIDRAVTATMGMVAIDRCADTNSISAALPLPDSPDAQRQISAVQNLLDEASVRQTAGQYKEALSIAQTATGQAETIGYAPLYAEALLRRGVLEGQLATPKESFATLGEAATTAATGRADRILAQAALAQFANLANKQLRFDAALAFWPLVRAIVERAGDDPDWRADLATTLGFVYSRMSRPRAARANLERAVAILTETYGAEDLRVLHPLNQLAYVVSTDGDSAAALVILRRAVNIITTTLGPQHPRQVPFVSNIGAMLIEQREYIAARPFVQRGIDIARASLGENHQKVAIGLTNRAKIAREQGDCDSADRDYAEAIRIFDKTLGHQSRYLSYPLLGAAKCRISTGDSDAARPLLERALALHERAGGDPKELADICFTLAKGLWQPDASLATRSRARQLARRARSSLRSATDAKPEQIGEVEAWLTARAGRDRIH